MTKQVQLTDAAAGLDNYDFLANALPEIRRRGHMLREVSHLSDAYENSTSLPPGVLSHISPQVVQIFTAQTDAEALLGPKVKRIDWAQDNYHVNIIGPSGATEPYYDASKPPISSTIYTYGDIGHYRFSTSFEVGNLDSRKLGLAGQNDRDNKIAMALMTLRNEFNRIALFGKLSSLTAPYDVHGIVNSPLLSNINEENKTLSNSTYDEIMAFFYKGFCALVKQTGGHVNANTKVRVGISSDVYCNIIGKRNNLGHTIREALANEWPNWTLHPNVLFTNAIDNNKNFCVFIADDEQNVGGLLPVCELGYSELGLFSRIELRANTEYGVVSSGTLGCIIYKPAFIVRYKGI